MMLVHGGGSDMTAKSKEHAELELEPDAWERFERAVKVVVKSPPQHRVKVKAKGRKRKRQSKGDMAKSSKDAR